MFEPTVMIVASASLLAIAMLTIAALRGWQGWLELKQREIETAMPPRGGSGNAMGAARIELADLRERIKKLEAIANGVDL